VASQTVGQQPAQQQQRGLLVIYSVLMLAMLLAALDQTIVSTALPTIVSWTTSPASSVSSVPATAAPRAPNMPGRPWTAPSPSSRSDRGT
jgi:hypothetical protein